MFVTYTPAAGDTQRWEFRPGKIPASHGELIEKRFGGPMKQFRAELGQESAKAKRVVLWYLLSLAHAMLKFEDVPDFALDEVQIQQTRAELEELRERTLQANLPQEQREAVLALVEREIADAPVGSDEGKAPSNSAANATSSPSPSS